MPTNPAWYQNTVTNRAASGADVVAEGGLYTMHTFHEPNTITLYSGAEEMIRCSTEGFWVRGEKVAQDDREAEAVYNAFKQWLTWATLNN